MATSTDVDKITMAEKSVTRAVDSREDMQLQLASHMNSQSMLNTAPMTVAVLGHLTLVTLHKDVDLRREGGQYKCIKYPESLRACTVQLANEGWSAFNLAEKNMDQIRLYTAQVPNHVKSSVKLILGGTKHEVANVLPNYVGVIQKTTEKCKAKAAEVQTAFMSVICLTQELKEACTVAQGNYEKKIATAPQEAEKKKMEIEASVKAEKELKLIRERMKQEIHDAKEKYDKQVKSMPGAAKLVGMAVADGVCQVIAAPGNLIKGLTSIFKGPNQSATQQGLENYIVFAEKATKELQKYVGQDNSGKDEVKSMKVNFESQLASLVSETGPEKEKLEEIYKKAIDLTSDMLDSQITDNDKLKQDMSRLQGMIEASQLFSQILNGGTPMSGTGPRMSKVDTSGPLDAYVKQAYFKVESAENTLRTAKEDFEKLTEKLERQNERNMNLLSDLSKVQLDRIDFDEVIDLLKKCMGALAEIHVEWGKLVRFFQILSNLIESEVEDSLGLFKETASTERDASLEYGFSEVMLDTLYTQTAQANGVALMACSISGMYVQISQQYLTDPLAALGGLLALDPKKDKKEIETKQEDLTTKCKEATTAVCQYITQTKEDFDSRVGSRIERIQREMMAVLPPRPKEDPETTRLKQKAIEEANELRRQEVKDREQYI